METKTVLIIESDQLRGEALAICLSREEKIEVLGVGMDLLSAIDSLSAPMVSRYRDC
jgi:hypothetical protein